MKFNLTFLVIAKQATMNYAFVPNAGDGLLSPGLWRRGWSALRVEPGPLAWLAGKADSEGD